MALTTNTEALPHVESRYELGMLASQRVRDLAGGAEPVVRAEGDKSTVVALREIAAGKLDMDNLRHEFIQSYKSGPALPDTEGAIESVSEDPTLREIDAELGAQLVDENRMPDAELQDEIDDSLIDINSELDEDTETKDN